MVSYLLLIAIGPSIRHLQKFDALWMFKLKRRKVVGCST